MTTPEAILRRHGFSAAIALSLAVTYGLMWGNVAAIAFAAGALWGYISRSMKS